MVTAINGTKEWAVAAIDCCQGCSNGCRYCYGRYKYVVKEKLLTEEQWNNSIIMAGLVEKEQPFFDGQVMFPTNHDILPDNLGSCVTVIEKLLLAGNRVLIVSKPHFSCITELCRIFQDHKENILFRFTITARDSSLLSYWEPAAPLYAERLKSLCYAHEQGFLTSVSIEPMLDSADVVAMVHELLPYVSHSIWIGKMNKIEQRVAVKDSADKKAIDCIVKGQEDDVIFDVYQSLKGLSCIRWKDSIKRVVGIDSPVQPGLDL